MTRMNVSCLLARLIKKELLGGKSLRVSFLNDFGSAQLLDNCWEGRLL